MDISSLHKWKVLVTRLSEHQVDPNSRCSYGTSCRLGPLSLTCDGLGASAAFLCIEVPKALDAVWLVILRGELLPGQGRPAARADKTLLVPRFIPVSDATLGQ